jgi:hypothetical protein
MIDDITLRRAMKNAYNSGLTQGDIAAREQIVDQLQTDITIKAWFTPAELNHLISVIERSENV